MTKNPLQAIEDQKWLDRLRTEREICSKKGKKSVKNTTNNLKGRIRYNVVLLEVSSSYIIITGAYQGTFPAPIFYMEIDIA